MGATHSSSETRYAVPTRPFHKHGHHRSCLGAAIVLPPGGGRRKHRQQQLSMSTLIQLVLLQDWQRVLIRATLFPKEITKPCVVHLYGRKLKVLPLHLACALQPPSKVVSTLAVGLSALLPVERPPTRRMVLRKWSLPSSSKSIEDQRDLLSTRSSTSGMDSFSLADDASSAAHHRRAKRMFRTRKRSSAFPSNGSLVSLEQSIGDGITISCGTHSVTDSTNYYYEDDADDEDSMVDSVLDHHHGVILQLTPTGDIMPMSMVLETQDTSTTTGEDDEEDEKSISSNMEFPKEAFLQAAVESKALLPIHLACLFQASPSVLETLLQAHPMGASSAVLGMLPIHLVAVGWKVEPVVPLSRSILSSMQDDTSAMAEQSPWTLQSLQLMIHAAPETATARSTLHGLLPMDYLGYNRKEFPKDECVEFLEHVLQSSGVKSCRE